jgi:uncharacterized membrane protein
MKRAVLILTVLLMAAAGAHFAAIFAYPRVAMDRAMARLSDEGRTINQWRHSAQVTPEARAVVRPAPDLAYSACVYDLWRGPIRIAVAPSGAYWSLSLYDAASDNFAVFNSVSYPSGATVTLVRPGAAPPANAGVVLESATRRGIALVRRLAPDPDMFALADAARQGDVCGAVGMSPS